MRPFYDALPRWRRPVLVLLAVLTAALVSQIPRLDAVFAPEQLVPPRPAESERIEAALEGFAGREEPLLVLVEAPDVLAPEPLGYAHRLATAFAERPWVARVESLTTTPLPRAVGFDEADGATLETLETLDDEPPSEREAAMEAALGRALATDPSRFPMGLASLDAGPMEVSPLVEPGRETLDADAVARVAGAVEDAPLLEGRLIDAERTVAAVVLVPAAALDEEGAAEAVEEVEGYLGAHPPPEGVRTHLGGLPAVRVAMVDALRTDQVLLVSLAILGSLLVLLLGFRSWAGVLLPLGAAGMTSGIVVGAMALVGEPLNLLNNVVPPLLITIGLGDAVHLLVRYREELRREPDRIVAARRTMRAMVGACLLTSVTTAVGFGSLLISETDVMRRFALTASAGVMLAYLVTVLFLPSALPDFRVRPEPEGEGATLERGIARVARGAVAAPWVALALALLVLGGAVALGRGVQVDSALLDQLQPGSDAFRTTELLEERLDGVRRIEVGLTGEPGRYRSAAGLRELAALEAWLDEQPEVLRASAATELTGALWRHVAPNAARGAAWADAERARALSELASRAAPDTWGRWVADDGARARVVVQVRDAGERRINALIDRLEERMEGTGAVVGGEAYRSARGLDRLVRDLLQSLALAVLVIFVVLGLLLRSLRLALISVLPNVLPLGVTVAWMALRGIPLHASTAIVFTVSIGLVVDGTIHILARYREEARAGHARRPAIDAAMRGSGRAVVIGAFTLLLGFTALLFGSFVPIRLFAELSIVAIASSLVAELTLLPALLVLFGPHPSAARAAEPARDPLAQSAD